MRDPDERAETEAYEALAAKDELRGRSLADVGLALLHRGDRVAVHAAGQMFRGGVVHAAGDLACLLTPTGDVDVRLPAATSVQVVAARPDAGT
ncbi:MAG: hypothetical protein ACRDU8_06955, partial [Egibacteraceae bacterium]